MDFINSIKQRAKLKKMKIVLPEIMDKRVMKAAEIVLNEDIADLIIIGTENEINKYCHDVDIKKATIINPCTSSLTDTLVKEFFELRKDKGMTLDKAKDILLNDYMYYACMLVKLGYADGAVSGACHSSANTLKPALQIIKNKSTAKLVSAFFLMVVPDCSYGENGIFIFADAGIEQNPTSESLAAIAKDSADSFKLLVEKEAKVAMLSHSTKGSASHSDVNKVVDAVNIAKENYPDYIIDGEFQLDAAIVPEIAKIKAPDSKVAGTANVLIFPDLDAANIGYKLVQRLAKANAYGPICQGIAAPINDLSRGCSISDIVGVIAITAVQAQKNRN